MQIVASVFASLVGVFSTLCMIVLLAAGLANAKPAQLQQGKWMMWGLFLLQLVVLVGAIVLMVKHKPWPAAAVGISPLAVVIVLVVILVMIEW
ncbi:MAG: hypothetical protein KF805_11785 [Phycisphaeraceae bacterium]|nr:hypothetical protein [Phycisphaeraceae bacterium]